VRQVVPEIFEEICNNGGIELSSLGIDNENPDSTDTNSTLFDPSKIKVDREMMSVFQVLRKIDLGEIQLNPDFQRNLVWDALRRCRLIESALLRLPLPAFYFDGVDANHMSVVDGLQRLTTLHDFINKKSLRLQGLEYLSTAEGKTFDELPRGMQRDLEETQITLFIIRPDTPPDVKFTIFYRINTGGLVLTSQEIRHALFQGASTTLLKTLATSTEFEEATDWGVSDSRMDARECVLRYLAFHLRSYLWVAQTNSGQSAFFATLTQGGLGRLLSRFQIHLHSLGRDAPSIAAIGIEPSNRFCRQNFPLGDICLSLPFGDDQTPQ
jgi:hypothetical protein